MLQESIEKTLGNLRSRIRSSVLTQRLFTGIAWTVGAKVVTFVLGLIVSGLLARLLTPDELGIYFLVWSFVTTFVVVSGLGMNQAVIRLVAEGMGTDRPGRARSAIRHAFLSSFLASLFLAVVFFVSVHWVSPADWDMASRNQIALLASIAIIVSTASTLLPEVFRGFHEIRIAVLLSGLAGSAIPAVLLGTLWLARAGSLPQVLLVPVIAGGVSILVGSWLLRRTTRGLGRDGELQLREVLIISAPLMVTSLIWTLKDRTAIWILGLFSTQADIAVYGAAERLMLMVVTPLLLVNFVIPPIVAEMYAQGERSQLEKTVRRVVTLASIPAFLALLVLLLFGSPILGLVYGDFYRQGDKILVILSVAQLVNVWAGSCGIVLMMTGYQVAMMQVTVFAGLVGIVLGVVLTSQFGASGMAIAASTALVVQNVGMWLSAKSKAGIWTHVSLGELLRLAKLL